jgi:hypothetical protein
MEETSLGTATIVYDHPSEGTIERTVDNEHIAYFQDHWLLRQDGSEDGDTVRRIPIQRVHYVDRNVEQFEDELGTLRRQVESIADDLRSKVFGGGDRSARETGSDPVEIDVKSDDGSDGHTDGEDA